MFPGVRQLNMERLPSHCDANGMANLLAAGYAKQLRMYKGKAVALPQGCVLERLESATIHCSFHMDLSGRTVQPSELQHLSLKIEWLVYPWDMFISDSSSGGDRNVEFPNLKSLMVSYFPYDPHVNFANNHRLHFPQLQSLKLQSCVNTCHLLHHVVLPTQMARFELSALPGAFAFLCGVELPVVEHMSVTIGSHLREPEALVHVGRFLSRVRGGKQDVTIRCSAADLLPELVPCTRLTTVKVSDNADVGMVLAFVTQLPFLRRLEFAYLTIGELPADLTITPLDKHETIEPLNTSLQTLSLRFDCSSKACDTVAKYLLMRLPNLIVFSVAGVSKKSALDFARNYSRFYPHLNNTENVFRDQRQQ